MKIIGYLDAGTGSLILQAVLGGAAGVAVLFKTVGKRFFKRSDEEATKDEPATSGDESA